MTVTSAPIGSTGQSLDGFAVDANVLQAFRESVVITDPTNSTGVAQVTSTWGLAVNVMSTVPVSVSVASTQIISSIPFYVTQSTSPWVVSTAPIALVGTASTQVVSSIPFYVSQSTSPWIVSSAPIAITGTSQVSGTVSSQVVSSIPLIVSQSTSAWQVQVTNIPQINLTTSIPLIVAQSSSPWGVSGQINVSSATATFSSFPLGTASTQIISSIPFFVSQSSSPWSIIGGINVSSQSAVSSSWPLNTTMVNVVSSLPFFVTQSSAPWIFSETASTAGGASAVVVSLAANLNTTVVKATPGQIYGVFGSNIGSSNVFVRFYNQSTAALTIASTGVPLLNFGMPISTSPSTLFDLGVSFNSGITLLTQQQPYTASSSIAPTASTATITVIFK